VRYRTIITEIIFVQVRLFDQKWLSRTVCIASNSQNRHGQTQTVAIHGLNTSATSGTAQKHHTTGPSSDSLNLPIRYRIDFKLAKLTFLARSSSTNSHFNSLVVRYLPIRTLHSLDTNLLAVPRTNTVFGSCVFHVAAPTVFNSSLRTSDQLTTSQSFAAF